MIELKINDKTINFPTSWLDVTFEQYHQMLTRGTDTATVLSILTGISEEVLRSPKTIVNNLDMMIEAIQFTREWPDFTYFSGKVGKYILPKDVTFESVAQYLDMMHVLKESKNAESESNTVAKYNEKLLKIVSIYCQKIRDGEYDSTRVTEMMTELRQCTASEVLAAGSFFIIKLMNLKKSTNDSSQKAISMWKKLKQALINFMRFLGLRSRSTA